MPYRWGLGWGFTVTGPGIMAKSTFCKSFKLFGGGVLPELPFRAKSVIFHLIFQACMKNPIKDLVPLCQMPPIKDPFSKSVVPCKEGSLACPLRLYNRIKGFLCVGRICQVMWLLAQDLHSLQISIVNNQTPAAESYAYQ